MKFLRRKDEEFLYGWTETLADKAEFLECDERGVAIVDDSSVLAKAAPKKQVISKSVSSMNDTELEAYARKEFGAELDRRKSMGTLRKQVRGLMAGILSPEDIANGLTDPAPVVEEEPEPEPAPVVEEPEPTPAPDPVFAIEPVPEMPASFENKNAAIRWARGKGLGCSFRSRDTKAKTIERIKKALVELGE